MQFNRVFVLTNTKEPIMPCSSARARRLLKAKKAAVYRRYPFTIILLDREIGDTQPIILKFDPGARTTGMALVTNQTVVWGAELTHKGLAVKEKLIAKRVIRRSRRNRKTRYRQARFLNRVKPKGWLPPSLLSRVDNLKNWVIKLSRICPVTNLAMELVKFDTQALENPEISGVQYQQGTLLGYEIREYLLEKWNRKCSYCKKENVPLEIEHIVPKSRGGSNRVSNLCLACRSCNESKNSSTAQEFGFPEIQALAKKPLKDAAAVNVTRWKLYEILKEIGLPVETGSGGKTKFNRINQGYEKTHWIDAACVGSSGLNIRLDCKLKPLLVKAIGRGGRQMCSMNRYGFPRTTAKKLKEAHGFRTGDFVKAVVLKGKKIGTYFDRVAIRATGSFKLGKIDGIGHKSCKIIQRSDGYQYA